MNPSKYLPVFSRSFSLVFCEDTGIDLGAKDWNSSSSEEKRLNASRYLILHVLIWGGQNKTRIAAARRRKDKEVRHEINGRVSVSVSAYVLATQTSFSVGL